MESWTSLVPPRLSDQGDLMQRDVTVAEARLMRLDFTFSLHEFTKLDLTSSTTSNAGCYRGVERHFLPEKMLICFATDKKKTISGEKQ